MQRTRCAAYALIQHTCWLCRALLLTGDYFLGGVVAGALTKLLLRLRKSTNAEAMEVNKLTAEAMLYIVSILRLGESQASLHPRDDDAVDRMVTCLKVNKSLHHAAYASCEQVSLCLTVLQALLLHYIT